MPFLWWNPHNKKRQSGLRLPLDRNRRPTRVYIASLGSVCSSAWSNCICYARLCNFILSDCLLPFSMSEESKFDEKCVKWTKEKNHNFVNEALNFPATGLKLNELWSIYNFSQLVLCGAFAILRKATVRFVVAILPYVHPHGTRLTLDGFSWNLIFEDF